MNFGCRKTILKTRKIRKKLKKVSKSGGQPERLEQILPDGNASGNEGYESG